MMDWQPIETAPKDGASVIVVASGIVGEAYFDQDRGEWWWANTSWGDYGPSPIRTPSHWMPLPPRPGENRNG